MAAKKTKKTATPARAVTAEDSAPKGEIANESSVAQEAAAPKGRQPSVIVYVKPNGRTRRGSVISTDGEYAHIRLEDGTEMRNVVRSKSADQVDCWKPA